MDIKFLIFGINKRLNTYMDIKFLIFGINKRLNRIRNFTYKVIRPRIKNNGEIEVFFNNFDALFGSYSDINCKWFNKKHIDEIIHKANQTLTGQFDILGSGKVQLSPIDWHTDFKSGYTWNKGKFYRDYKQVDLSNNADVKVPREISRCHFLLWLGQAYLFTKEEKYAQQIQVLIDDWIEENPLMFSINWGCAMDVAIRAVNWIFAVNMIRTSSSIDENFKTRFLQSIYEHGWFIYNNIEKSFENNGNHYDSDIVALLFLGRLFTDTKKGGKWYRFALNEYYKEVREQILPSGVIYEKTTSYIRLVQEIFSFAYIVLLKSHVSVPPDIIYRLEKSFEFTLNYIKSNGKAPNIGDQDNARWLPFTIYHPLDHKQMLSIGTILFQREDFKAGSTGFIPDLFLLFGKNVKLTWNRIPNKSFSKVSKAYFDAGFFILKKNNTSLFINNSGLGKLPDRSRSYGSHTHADLLSFDLHINGCDIFIDSGTYVYTSNHKSRNQFRSTLSHNTLVIDDEDQYQLSSTNLFAYKTGAHPKHLKWKDSAQKTTYSGSHNAYQRLSNPATHRRSFIFKKRENKIYINDFINGKGTNKIDLYLYLNPEVKVVEKGNHLIKIASQNSIIDVFFKTKNTIQLAVEECSVSMSYGTLQPSNRIHLQIFKKTDNCFISSQIAYYEDIKD